MFKSKKTTVFTITSLIILCFIILFGYYKANRIEEDIELKKEIVKMVNKSEEVNFQKITDFDWDNIYIYSHHIQIRKMFLKKIKLRTITLHFE